MILGIDPKVDYAFKHVFGRESTRPILIDVLDSVLNAAPGHRIQEVELLNPFNPKEALDDKLSILDIKARDQSGRQFNVEMQMFAEDSYPKRILYYATKLHHQQLHAGEEYAELKPTISISFVDSTIYPGTTDYHLRFRVLEATHHFSLCDDIEFHILELPKFAKTHEQLGDNLDIWLYFLRHAEKMDTEAIPEVLQQPLVLRALEELKMLAQSDIERERYEARRKAQLDYNSGMKEAHRKGHMEGHMEGRLEGRLEGRAEGRQEGQQLIVGAIQLFERLLNRPETPFDQLNQLSPEELSRLATGLQDQLQARK